MLSSHQHLVFPRGLFRSGFPNKMYSYLIPAMFVPYPAHLILDLIILIIFGEDYKL